MLCSIFQQQLIFSSKMKMDKLEKQEEFKAFQGFVNKCLYDFHEDHPNESVSRKKIEEKCFGTWSVSLFGGYI